MQRTPKIKILPGQEVSNRQQDRSATQSFESAVAGQYYDGFNLPLKFILKDEHVTATRHVPGPLPLLGAAAAFSYSRKLRRSLKSKGGDASYQKQ